jgi:hypothetical protein
MVERFIGSDFAFPYADPLSTPRQRRRFSEQALTDRIRKQTMEQTPEGLRTSGIGAVTSVLAPLRAATQVPTLVGSAITRAGLPTSVRAAIDASTKIKPSMVTGFRSTVPGAVAPRVATGLIPKTASSMGPGAAQLAMLSMLGGDVPEEAPAPAPQVSTAMPTITTPTPAGKAAESVNEGARVATLQNQDRRESSFLDTLLGNVDVAGLLQVFARPEFLQPGQSFAQGFSRAAAARTAAQQAQEATEAKAQREQEELDIARQRAAAADLTAEAAMKRAERPLKGTRLTGKALIEAMDNIIDVSENVKKARGDKTRLTFLGDKPTDKEFNTFVRARAIDIYNANPSIGTEQAINLALGVGQAQPATDPYANIGR